jgi:hypothetical protein
MEVFSLNKSEDIIKEYFIKQGFEVERFSREEMINRKTPDFKIIKDRQIVLFCEVKEINEDLRNSECGVKDNTYNIVSECINDSYKQFASVNPEHRLPNVLAIYSRRLGIDILDFKFTVEGGFQTEDDKFLPWLKNISEGRIKDRKKIIDMCFWYDEHKNEFKKMFSKESIFYNELKNMFVL